MTDWGDRDHTAEHRLGIYERPLRYRRSLWRRLFDWLWTPDVGDGWR